MGKWILMVVMMVWAGTAESQIKGTFSIPSGVLRADPNAFITITTEYPIRSITVVGLDSLNAQHIAAGDSLCYEIFILSDLTAMHPLVGGIPNVAVTSDQERYYWFFRLAKEAWLYSNRIVLANLDGSREEYFSKSYLIGVARTGNR